jgi:hypothetical protein
MAMEAQKLAQEVILHPFPPISSSFMCALGRIGPMWDTPGWACSQNNRTCHSSNTKNKTPSKMVHLNGMGRIELEAIAIALSPRGLISSLPSGGEVGPTPLTNPICLAQTIPFLTGPSLEKGRRYR